MQVTNVVQKFPLVSLQWTIEWENQKTSQLPSVKAVDVAGHDEEVWLKVPLAMECIVKAKLTRINHFKVSDNILLYTYVTTCIDSYSYVYQYTFLAPYNHLG